MAELSILAMDIASQAGWAYGAPGTVPRAGTVRWAPPSSSNGKVGAGMIRWVLDFLRMNPAEAVYFEAPFDPRIMARKTNFDTTRVLVGLPFLFESILNMKGVGRVREVTVGDARRHFLGRVRRDDDGKALVQQRCRELGWRFDSPDAADALAVWSFACAVEAPKAAIATTPLFQNDTEAHRQLVASTWPDLSAFGDIEDIPS